MRFASNPVDGCNGLFTKKYWDIIKNDFNKLVQDFFDGSVNLQSIDDSFITLVPKNSNSEGRGVYLPISLLNSCIKVITKIRSNCL